MMFRLFSYIGRTTMRFDVVWRGARWVYIWRRKKKLEASADKTKTPMQLLNSGVLIG